MFVRKFLFLSMTVCASVFGASVGTCTQGTLSGLIGNTCGLGDKIFTNFSYTGNVDPANVGVDFQMAGNGTEFRIILAPTTGAGFFTNFTFTDTITVVPGLAPNIAPAAYQIVSVKDQSNFSAAAGSAGLLNIVNSSGPTYNLVPGNETGGATAIAPVNTVTTTAKLTGANGTGSASPGLSSFELGYLQANTAVPEPAPYALIGIGLLGLGVLRKRRA